jgi:hypothetical protein
MDIRKGESVKPGSRGISVGIEAMLDIRGTAIRFQAEERLASTPQRPDRI